MDKRQTCGWRRSAGVTANHPSRQRLHRPSAGSCSIRPAFGRSTTTLLIFAPKHFTIGLTMHYNSSTQTQKATDSMTTRRGKLMLFLKGVAMGLGDSVPVFLAVPLPSLRKFMISWCFLFALSICTRAGFSLQGNSRRFGSISTERSCLFSRWEFCLGC